MRRLSLVLLLVPAFAAPGSAEPTVTFGAGETCVRGELIVKLEVDAARRVGPAKVDGAVRVGEPVLDELGSRWGVSGFERIWRHPEVPATARRAGVDRQYLVSFDPGTDIEPVLESYRACPAVEYACPNVLLPADGPGAEVPDDSLYPEQWHLPHIGAPAAWDFAHGDTNVIVAVLDDGLRWKHPDIEPNLWINPYEDINGNGRFDSTYVPLGDLDGIDQDGNGYADDVIGYNFVYGRGNPMPQPADNHGTQCWGIANAVTDNRTGVAAPPWNVRGMGLCCGGGGYINLNAVISAIYYARMKGAGVFSMSFGSSTPYPALRDACQYASQDGALLCASVGNDGAELVRYPACYDGVLAVASSGRADMKSPWSNYGTWVDITAPGEDILTTSGPDGYASVTGNSASPPLVAGVLAWLKSAFPGASRDSIENTLFAWADSMPDPLYVQGKLGHGRACMTDSSIVGLSGGRCAPWSSVPATVVRAEFEWNGTAGAALFDRSGRRVMRVEPGRNDIRALPDGVYCVVAGDRPCRRLVKTR